MNLLGKLTLVSSMTVALFLAGCGAKTPIENPSLETVLPPDVAMVISVDYSDPVQIENIKKIVKSFPNTGIWDAVIEEFNKEVGRENAYAEMIQPFLEDEWRFLMGMSFEQEFETLEELEALGEEDVEIYLVGEFAKPDEFETLMIDLLEDDFGDDLKMDEDEELKYWTVKEDDFYMVRHEDLFFVTNTLANRDAAINRLRSKKSFKLAEEFVSSGNLSEDSLGYMYLSGKGFLGALGNAYKSFEDFGDIFLTVIADEDGLRFASAAKVTNKKSELIEMIGEYDLSLINKVPGEGMMMYMEYPSLSLIAQSFVEGLVVGMDAGSLEANASGAQSDEYQEGLKSFADSIGVTGEEVEELLDSPFAFAVSDVGELYPAIAVYLDVEDAVAAKELVNVLDDFVDESLKELDALVAGTGFVDVGIIKKDLDVVNGGGMRRLYLDWSVVPKEFIDEMSVSTGINVAGIDIELFYGVTGDGVLTLALHPGFADAYGNNVLAENRVYMGAVENLGGSAYGSSVSFIDLAPLVKLMDRYVKIGELAGVVNETDLEDYDLLMGFLKTIKYMISSADVDGDLVLSDAFVGIE